MGKIRTTSLKRQYVIVFVTNLSVICLGLGVAWTSPVLVKLRRPDSIFSRPITDDEGSWIVSIPLLSSTVSYFLPGYLADRIGRKYSLILGCMPRFVMGLLFIFGNKVWMLLLGQILSGISEAFTFSIVPMYTSEIASKEIRGKLGTIFQVCSSFGVLIMLSMGPFMSYTTLNIALICIITLTTIPLFFLPDSPYFLYRKGYVDKCLKVLTFLRGSELLASEELKEYSLSSNRTSKNMETIFKNKTFLKATAIVLIIAVWMQLIGFNTVSFYLQTILESTNTSIKPEIASVIIGVIQLCAGFCTVFITDKFGRKPILTTTLIGMTVGMLGLGTFFQLNDEGYEIFGFLNYLPLISLILVVYCFSGGPGSIYYVLIAEVFDGEHRAIGMTISLFTATGVLFLLSLYFPAMTTAIGRAGTYWFFATNCVCLMMFILICVPETKGKTFNEIQIALGQKIKTDKEKEKGEIIKDNYKDDIKLTLK